MIKYLIEPVQNESDLESLNIEEIALNDFTFLIKKGNTVVGYSQLIPVGKQKKNKALWIQKIICNNPEASKKLLKEIAMYSWELGYDAIFSDCSHSECKEAGFIELNSKDTNLSVCPDHILALELSWEGLKKFEKRN